MERIFANLSSLSLYDESRFIVYRSCYPESNKVCSSFLPPLSVHTRAFSYLFLQRQSGSVATDFYVSYENSIEVGTYLSPLHPCFLLCLYHTDMHVQSSFADLRLDPEATEEVQKILNAHATLLGVQSSELRSGPDNSGEDFWDFKGPIIIGSGASVRLLLHMLCCELCY
jgi:hypothetical protein